METTTIHGHEVKYDGYSNTAKSGIEYLKDLDRHSPEKTEKIFKEAEKKGKTHFETNDGEELTIEFREETYTVRKRG